MSIAKHLVEFEEQLRKFNPIEYNKLQDPISDVDIEKYLQEIIFDHPEILALYHWKNGAKPNDDCRIMIFGAFLPLENLVQKHKLDRDNSPYDKDLIVIVDDIEEKLLINSKNSSSHFGKIYLYSVPSLYIDFPISIYDSLDTMIETNIVAYKKKIFIYNYQNATFNYDFSQYSKIAKELNRESMFWRDHDPLREEDWYAI